MIQSKTVTAGDRASIRLEVARHGVCRVNRVLGISLKWALLGIQERESINWRRSSRCQFFIVEPLGLVDLNSGGGLGVGVFLNGYET